MRRRALARRPVGRRLLAVAHAQGHVRPERAEQQRLPLARHERPDGRVGAHRPERAQVHARGGQQLLRPDADQAHPAAPVRARHERAELRRAPEPRGLRVRLQLRRRARRREREPPVRQPPHRQGGRNDGVPHPVRGRRAGLRAQAEPRRRGRHRHVLLRHGPQLRPSPVRLPARGRRPRRARRLVRGHDARPAAVRRQERQVRRWAHVELLPAGRQPVPAKHGRAPRT